MAESPDSVLFVPVSGPGGSGEYYRCLAIARALRAHRPGLVIHFLVNRHARLERDARFHYHELNDSPTRDRLAAREYIEQLRPALVLFDSAGRMMHFRAARAVGARVAWLSDRPNKRRKAFRWRMLPLLDLHLMAAPGEAAPRLSFLHRFKQRCFPGLKTVFFSGIAPPADASRRQALCDALGLPDSDYLLFAPGGGGYERGGRPVPEIMLEAAAISATETGLPAIMLMGPQYKGAVESHETVRVVKSLPTEDLSQLLGGARLAVIGAGSMMTTQTLSLGVPAVLVPAGGDDQPPRINDFSRRGLVSAAPMEAGPMAEAAIALARDADRRAAQQAAVRDAGIRNDVELVAAGLLELLSAEC
ncbi:hypothetical protein [Natronospira bacteriovora]|uniref:Glycosyltransferase n=1 Tax=Natronospira bacteriovora TaxID=3069753 RepID=A0ABU0W6G3_9GAMM|nr:hypothetical protein [Natronospira sp. AB-CW4]MDQ2069620.1 hypothetical protein [Natronospira sp. AB-CW4]